MDLKDPIQVMAGTLWGEARGGGVIGMQSVANVIMNRVNHPRWWGHDALSVCLDPWQFSCWNGDDPNRAKILAVEPTDMAFATALGLAKQAIAGRLPDITEGADSYYEPSEHEPPPPWAERATYTKTIAGQRFYRVELAAPSGLPEAPACRPQRGLPVPELPPESVSFDDLNAAELERIKGADL